MPDRVILRLGNWLTAKGYRPFHDSPLAPDADDLSHWTKSDKHNTFTGRDSEFLRCYVLFALAASSPFAARGIEVPGRGFVRPDVAVMNSCLNAEMAVLDGGLFKITEKGLNHLGLAVPA